MITGPTLVGLAFAYVGALFLIGSVLLKEVDRSGTVDGVDFAKRRARRLARAPCASFKRCSSASEPRLYRDA